jgi:ferredoxin
MGIAILIAFRPTLERKGINMPKLTVDGVTFDVLQDKRLVLALTDEAGVDQLHACGGNARCTTCRVEFVAGEPEMMTKAEKDVLAARLLTGVRLSCQIRCDHDMSVKAISRFAGSGRKDSGKRPEDAIQPSAGGDGRKVALKQPRASSSPRSAMLTKGRRAGCSPIASTGPASARRRSTATT